MKVPSDIRATEVETVAAEVLSETEHLIGRRLQQWDALFKSTDAGADQAHKAKKTRKQCEINLGEVSLELIDSITTTLAELRSELEKITEPI
jgi:hypothetical protein